MALSTPIPPPLTDWESTTLRLVAAVTTFSGGILVYWWVPHRSVVIYVSERNEWYLQNDMPIRESLADLMNWDPYLVRSREVFMFTGRSWGGAGAFLPPFMSTAFLDCEWSDYACEHRVIDVTVFERAEVPQSAESLSDDESMCVTPPGERRRWRMK